MIFKFDPIPVTKIWGGTNLSKIYNVEDDKIGEVWGISAHVTNSTKIVNTRFKGLTMRNLYVENKEFFGSYDKTEFPILMKVIDAAEDLSIQVHPNDDYARNVESSFGKDESWHILETYFKDSNIIIGHKAKTKDELLELIKNDSYDNLLNKMSITKGDYFYINSGKIHAICKGTILLEISQSSNITYRLYDYNRLDNGKLRELHVHKAIDNIMIPDDKLHRKNPQKYFIDYLKENNNNSSHIAHIYGDYIYLVDGECRFNDTLAKKGDFLMISSLTSYQINGKCKYVLVNLV
jgi:mannose-6-phosphate isomerase